MNENILLPVLALQKENAIKVIRQCNDFTSQFGLSLATKDVNDLVECQHETLKYMGRIEFGNSIIPKLVFEFCDSQYISQDNYVEVLEDLQEMFFYFKNESLDKISDDELIHGMKKYFDGECQGSLEKLRSTYLEKMCKNSRYSLDLYRDIE
ncbi:hypothetical protein JYG23_10315 [Sedimentibacter sp. zth1]|uniref:DUF6323 family protein n=1 Tax=Sedimentibacter sp. zth1 TaxID=2816908 RepID=UPI001A924551|nr:DUF6323 family protein [Sedimentibacter sp. zth1]QSX05080.1 hypothetical protein JYG23_10315 [Sedimentibacter sp. zth1]